MGKKRSVGITAFGVVMFLFSIFSIFYGLIFFPRPLLELSERIARLLILVSGIVYFMDSIFIFKLRKRARILIIYYSIFLLFYFIPLFLNYIFYEWDPGLWKEVIAISISPYIIFPLFFIIFFTRPKVKEQFG